MTFRRIILLCCGVLLTACTPNVAPKTLSSPAAQQSTAQPHAVLSPTVQPSIATAAPAFTGPIDVAGPALIAAERAASIAQDRARLRQLWSDDARIVDGRGTATPEDDYIWQGRPAILDRYELAVFPSPPPPLEDPALPAATIKTDAPAETAIIEHGGDRWRLVRRDGRWWLAELVYGTPLN